MKALHRCTIGAGVFIAAQAFAIFGIGDVVFDPQLNAWNIAHESKESVQWANELLKAEQQIQNQLAQLEQLRQALDVQNRIRSSIGDWYGVYQGALDIKERVQDLTKPIGSSWDSIAVLDYGQPLRYTANGRYRAVTTTTAHGRVVEIPEEYLRRYGSFEKRFDEAEEADLAAEKEIKELSRKIATIYEDMARGDTEAKTIKYKATLDALQARLSQIRAEILTRHNRALAQRALDENERAKEQFVRQKVLDQQTKDEAAGFAKLTTGGKL